MRFRAYAIPDAEPEKSGAAIDMWLQRWQADVTNFSDTGCGCCVHILRFDAGNDAIKDLESVLGVEFTRHAEGTEVP